MSGATEYSLEADVELRVEVLGAVAILHIALGNPSASRCAYLCMHAPPLVGRHVIVRDARTGAPLVAFPPRTCRMREKMQWIKVPPGDVVAFRIPLNAAGADGQERSYALAPLVPYTVQLVNRMVVAETSFVI